GCAEIEVLRCPLGCFIRQRFSAAREAGASGTVGRSGKQKPLIFARKIKGLGCFDFAGGI
ncbi:MAG: hypothetical protein KAX90_00210, partial [Pseudomonas sp.]|nr:hypothetical protein [Pseudomonas sp.]